MKSDAYNLASLYVYQLLRGKIWRAEIEADKRRRWLSPQVNAAIQKREADERERMKVVMFKAAEKRQRTTKRNTLRGQQRLSA